ncbi:hypothetical protein ACFSHQ_13555 [Gemmobacter lanyuensis]
MTIGNALYTRFTTTRFDSINSELNALQGQIAEGTNDARPRPIRRGRPCCLPRGTNRR